MNDQQEQAEHFGTFAWVPSRLLFDPNVDPASKLVYCALASYADIDGLCWPRQQPLAKALGVNQPAISKHIAKLEAAGWLVRSRHKRNFYRLIFPQPVAKPDGDNIPDDSPPRNMPSRNSPSATVNNIPVVVTDQKKETDQDGPPTRTRARAHTRVAPPQAPPPGAAFPHFAEWLQRPEQATLRLYRRVFEQQAAYNRARSEHNWQVAR